MCVPPGDDAAVLTRGGLGEVVTVDALVEGHHFDHRLSAEDVGFKAIAVSVSDLGAMGAQPRWAVLALSLPDPRQHWVEGFAAGFGEACRRWGVSLIGGDTTGTSGPAVISVTMGGTLVGPALQRRGAVAGDTVWVTGTLGLAGAGWRLADPPPEALAALRRPDPPLAFALALARQHLASAAMDLSDGLALDLPKLAARSGVGVEIDPDALPGHPALGDDALLHQTCGGEDYALLFTAPAMNSPAIEALARAYGVRLTAIGEVTPGGPVALRGVPWPSGSFSHFGAVSSC